MLEILRGIPDVGMNPLKYVFEVVGLKHAPNTLWLEFGVFSGSSINYISKFTRDHVYGFDSFEGLPEDWREGFPKGAFSKQGTLPSVNQNVVLIKGWFNDTLPHFLATQQKKISFIHMDCDLYSSTKFVFDTVKDYLADNCVIIFDELLNYPGFDGDNGELKALYEFVTENKVRYSWIGMNGKIGMSGYEHEKAALCIHSISGSTTSINHEPASKVIFSTFAGRFDRMHLLIEMVQTAIEKGYVSEFHLWDFCREQRDRDQLDMLCPIGFTPGDSVMYGDMRKFIWDTPFTIKTDNKVHIALSYITIQLTDQGICISDTQERVIQRTDQMRLNYGYQDNTPITLHWHSAHETLSISTMYATIEVKIPGLKTDGMVKLGSKSDTMWDFGSRTSVFKVSPSAYNRTFSEYYRHYNKFHKILYEPSVLIKADDDILFFTVERLPDFIHTCRSNTSAMFVSANVINNAYQLYPNNFGQQFGLTQDERGLYEALYKDGCIAEKLHMAFIENPRLLSENGIHELRHQQISINFVGFRSAVFPYFEHIAKSEYFNDEWGISVGIPEKYRLNSCMVVKGFVACHLSFYTQNAAMNVAQLVSRYASFRKNISY